MCKEQEVSKFHLRSQNTYFDISEESTRMVCRVLREKKFRGRLERLLAERHVLGGLWLFIKISIVLKE